WARKYAEQHLGFQRSEKPEDHKRLRKHLQDQGRTELASCLDKLRKWRNACDYDDEVPKPSNMASDGIRFADRVIQECK
ncbi:MAG: hypothetical protein ACP5RN_14705, partial [Armatimonadota bacterium]